MVRREEEGHGEIQGFFSILNYGHRSQRHYTSRQRSHLVSLPQWLRVSEVCSHQKCVLYSLYLHSTCESASPQHPTNQDWPNSTDIQWRCESAPTGMWLVTSSLTSFFAEFCPHPLLSGSPNIVTVCSVPIWRASQGCHPLRVLSGATRDWGMCRAQAECTNPVRNSSAEDKREAYWSYYCHARTSQCLFSVMLSTLALHSFPVHLIKTHALDCDFQTIGTINSHSVFQSALYHLLSIT